MLQLTRLVIPITGLLLATRKFPQAAQQPFIKALVNQHLAGLIEHHTHTNDLQGQRLG